MSVSSLVSAGTAQEFVGGSVDSREGDGECCCVNELMAMAGPLGGGALGTKSHPLFPPHMRQALLSMEIRGMAGTAQPLDAGILLGARDSTLVTLRQRLLLPRLGLTSPCPRLCLCPCHPVLHATAQPRRKLPTRR